MTVSNVTAFMVTLMTANHLILDPTDSNHAIAKDLNQILSKAVGSHSDALRTKQEKQGTLSKAEGGVYEILQRMECVLNIQPSEDEDGDGVFAWHPMYEYQFVSIITNCEHYQRLSGCKLEFLLLWIYTKYRFLGADGLVTDNNSIFLICTVFDAMQQNSEKNALKTQSFWTQFVLPSIRSEMDREFVSKSKSILNLNVGQIIDSFLQTFHTHFQPQHQEQAFLSHFDELQFVFADRWRPLQRHFLWIFKFKSIPIEIKEQYFKQWMAFGAVTISKTEDAPNHVLLNELVFNHLLDRNQSIGMTKYTK